MEIKTTTVLNNKNKLKICTTRFKLATDIADRLKSIKSFLLPILASLELARYATDYPRYLVT